MDPEALSLIFLGSGVTGSTKRPMKTLTMIFVAFSLAGCTSLKKGGDTAAVRSEREYATGSEALAQDLYKTRQAPSIEAARAQAASAANREWARAAKAKEQKQSQAKFEKDLAKVGSSAK